MLTDYAWEEGQLATGTSEVTCDVSPLLAHHNPHGEGPLWRHGLPGSPINQSQITLAGGDCFVAEVSIFQSLDVLKQVSGIGDKLVEKIRDLVGLED